MNNWLTKKTQVVVITYNPEINLLQKNLQAILEQFESVLIVDNGSKNIAEIEKLLVDNHLEIKLKKLGQNTGIANAQNVGLQKASEKNFDWLLTMDQDSIIPDNLSAEYQRVIESHDNVGLVGWNQQPKASDPEVKEDWWIVSSGCLISVEALNKVRGFDQNFFIDHVDTDVNIKIRNLGLKTLVTKKVKLFHQLGEETKHKTLRGKNYHQHSPLRVYYIIRNGTTLFRRYFFRQPRWMLMAIKNNFGEGAYLLLYQPNKIKNFFLILRAWFDGIFNRLGEFNK
ncbi:MAG: glycosyltransferase family 2 protein [Candidatus Berkelbacteria bacterium]|nr:glycosyltransferase family 2 protein [Candidatus Berkelbacteria bacterium]